MSTQHLDLRTEAAILTATSNTNHFDAYSGAGSHRTYCMRTTPADPDCEVVIETGNGVTDSGAGVPLLTLKGAAVSKQIDGGAGNLRYRVKSQNATINATVAVWVEAPADAQGPAGSNGAPWITNNNWAAVTGTAYVPVPGEFVKVNTAANTTVTLPSAIGCAGQRIRIQDATGGAATHNITVATSLSQTVDGAAPAAITANNGGQTYVSDGANWFLGS